MLPPIARVSPPMLPPCTRRQLLGGLVALLAPACAAPRPAPAVAPSHPLADLEARVGGRVGLFAIDTGTGRQLAHRADERFAMCSTFKWILAAAILARADRAELSLHDAVPYGPAELLEYSPVTREHVADGAMTVEALAEAVVTVSDNTAANLLLAKIDGPAGLTRFVRAQGDPVTRLDRIEPSMGGNAPGDPRDTTSPRAMAMLMRRVVLGDALSASSRETLVRWLRACETGKERLRAGMPKGWVIGDKTGTGERGAVNDVAIAWPPGRPPIIVAAYLSDGEASPEGFAAAHADIGRIVAREL